MSENKTSTMLSWLVDLIRALVQIILLVVILIILWPWLTVMVLSITLGLTSLFDPDFWSFFLVISALVFGVKIISTIAVPKPR